MAAPFRVKALYEYSSPHEDDLSFGLGQVITVTEEEDDEWYFGEYVDDTGAKREGIFPRNFVEKFEPTAPPRPTRSRPKKEVDAAQLDDDAAVTALHSPVELAEASSALHNSAKEIEPVPESEPAITEPPLSHEPTSLPTAKPASTAVSSTMSKPTEITATKSKPAPPPVSEKPSSFKDRIAAFNKPAAPPIAPFKPAGLGSSAGHSSFVKKSFVAPPPSRDAYVPVPREKPTTTVYRRDEDPEIKERTAETLDQAEKAGLVPADQPQEGDDDDEAKPTSLKERIALLQRQQMEQAQRHADAAAKKEKPKKPLKKRAEGAALGEDPIDVGDGPTSAEHPHPETADSEPRTSTDDAHGKGLSARRRATKETLVNDSNDGNEADMSGAGDTTEGQDDTTEREDGEESSRHMRRAVNAPIVAPAIPNRDTLQQHNTASDEVAQDDDEEVEEDEYVDSEAQRKADLRARMAKMSAGMGFPGMFGAPLPPSAQGSSRKKTSKPTETSDVGGETEHDTPSRAPPPPIPTAMALPGMNSTHASSRARQETEGINEDEFDGNDLTPLPSRATAPPPAPVRAVTSSTRVDDHEEPEDEDGDNVKTSAPMAESTPPRRRDASGPPPIPSGRPAPHSLPIDSRAPPLPSSAELIKSPTDGSESDDELDGGAKDRDLEQTGLQAKRSPPLSPRREDYFPSSPSTSTAAKRTSRPPPPIPGSAPSIPPASSRPPPPPPPGDVSRQAPLPAVVATPTRPARAGDEEYEEVTEYEGDYDTDIGSSVPHKDALKAHNRDSSTEENALKSPSREAPPVVPPPIPSAAAPRTIPPPIPSQPPPAPDSQRRSVDAPRAAPPPPPPGKESLSLSHGVDPYDAYDHGSLSAATPLGPSFNQRTPKIDEEHTYFSGATATTPVSSAPDRRPPPSAPPARPGNKQSLDLPRRSTSNKRSMDLHRPSVESDFIANDVDLGVQSMWWKQAGQVPPAFQGRKDIHIESEESTTTSQGAKAVITRDIVVLFQDYSQTIVTVRFDPYDPTDAEMEQRHEPPPRALRQDQMEEFYERYGRQISTAATSRKDTVVGDGTPQGFVTELLRPLSGALPPVGTRSYGALVYANMANASTQQQDVIRAGDIISFRNAKFQGKHGPMHAKYSAEVGKPDHVAVVAEWDGTKKKVRAWEQGRENKKTKLESYKLDDLRSGEVKIWRVVPRTWVGWNVQP